MLALVDPPSKVHQDDFSPAKGNALQACVASLFGQLLDQVPNFIALDVGYEQGIRDFVEANSKCTAKKNSNHISEAKDKNNDEGKLCIVRGKSPRGDFGHVVVARIEKGHFKMVFDPHPEATFLDESDAYGWYMVFPEV